jgi:hypothetical protein
MTSHSATGDQYRLPSDQDQHTSEAPTCIEMCETPQELSDRWPILSPLLSDCKPLNESWAAWDSEASSLKRKHGIIVVVAAIFGTLAVLLAIWQLAWSTAGENTRFMYAQIEFIVAAITFITVFAGVFVQVDKRWILERFRAEQCRFVKFAFMRQASFWLTQSPASRSAFIDQCLGELRNLTEASVRKYIRNELELSSESEHVLDEPAGSSQLIQQLRDFWLAKRINLQKEYFHARSKALSKVGSNTRRVLPILFYLSLLCAGIHFGVDAYWHLWGSEVHDHQDVKSGSEHPPAQAQLLAAGGSSADQRPMSLREKFLKRIAWITLVAAASLPVLALGLRSLRSAFEFDRNENRFHGLHKRLEKLAQRLPPNVSAQQLSRVSAATEVTLKDEHRGWLRLMIEAEWF